jgi:ferredoxin-type protein NapF
MVDASRRGFFRGRPRPQAEIRPPWALAEDAFVATCTRCGDCLAACPERILVVGDGGYPTVAFANGECTFCSACVDACRPGALLRAGNAAPWKLVAVAGADCLPRKGIECRVCGDFCGARAIRFTPRIGGSPLPEIDGERCTGCGACVAPCPVAAMTVAAPAAG